MFEDVESYLTNTIGADSAAHLLEALKLLDDIDYQDHIFPLRNMMGDYENHSMEENVGYIRSIINDNYILILQSMSVTVIEDTPLSVLYSLLFTLSKIEDYEIKSELKAIIDNGNNPEEILADFVRVFRLEDPVNIIEYIESVSSDLIEKIDDLCQKELKNTVEPTPINNRYIKENAKRYFTKYANSYIRELIRNGYSLGDKENFIKGLEEHFSTIDPTIEQYAIEILAVMVCVTDADVLPDAQNLTETFVPNADEMIKVNALMERMYRELWPYEEK